MKQRTRTGPFRFFCLAMVGAGLIGCSSSKSLGEDNTQPTASVPETNSAASDTATSNTATSNSGTGLADCSERCTLGQLEPFGLCGPERQP